MFARMCRPHRATRQRSDRGFTLIELLITVAVVGALLAVGIPSYLNSQRTANDSNTAVEVSHLANLQRSSVIRGFGALTWSSGQELPEQLKEFGYKGHTQIISVGDLGGQWCIIAWSPRGHFDSIDNPIWASSSSHAVMRGGDISQECHGVSVEPDPPSSPISVSPSPDATPTTHPEIEPSPGSTPPPSQSLIDPGDPGSDAVGGIFRRAVYSATSLTFTNSWSMVGIDADLYVDGDFACNSAVHIYGNVTATGNAYITNSCTIDGSLIAGGEVRLDSQGSIGMNLLAVGDITQQSTTRVGQGIFTGGWYRVSDYPHDPTSFTIGWVVDHGMAQSVEMNAQVTPPLSVSFPALEYTPQDWQGHRTVGWKDWIKEQTQDNAAPSWASGNSGTCAVFEDSWSVGGKLEVRSDTVVDARSAAGGCSTLEFNNAGIVLTADLTLIVDALRAGQNFSVTSGDGQPHVLRIIVPGSQAVCGNSHTIYFGNSTRITAPVRTLVYTPGLLHIDGSTDLVGQLIGGCVNSSGNVRITHEPVAVPGWQ